MITNFGFHILSLLVFGGLLYAIVRLMGALRLSLLLSRSAFGSEQTVLIDWPLAFMVRVGRLVRVPITLNCSQKLLAARRLDLRSWAMLLLAPELVSIAVEASHSSAAKATMRVVFRRAPSVPVKEAIDRLISVSNNDLAIEQVV